jgi:rhodanese-related sulfurtransferase
MANPYGVPELTVQEVAQKREAGEAFVWLDVREPDEIATVAIPDEAIVHVPLSRLAAQQVAALPPTLQDDKEADVVVFCHHGVRSAQVVAWLRQQGWQNAWNMGGGVDAWATHVDPTIGTY